MIVGVSIILVVGVAIGVVSTVHRNHNDNETLSLKLKAVSNFCSFTHYRESCHKTLSSVNSTDPKEFISKAILAAKEAVKKFFNYSDSLLVQVKNNNLTKMALNDCKDMMDYAVDSLQASYSDVGDSELRNINDHKNDLRNWLSVVISYQQSCLNGFEHDNNMKETMQKGIIDAHELTGNALTITTKLSDILSKFGIQLNNTNSHRLHFIEKNVYPSWFSVKDRHLLARIDNSNLKPNVVVAKDGSGQFKTIAAIGNEFIAKSMGFQNTASPEKIDAYQDTLCNQANCQFFRNCVISGTIDFIFGNSPTVIQNSLIIVRRPMDNQFNTVTAQGKDFIDENTGTVIQNYKIVPEQKLFNDRFKIATYLDRPWKKFSTTIIMESILGDFIKPERWIHFEGPDKVNYEETLYYVEYNNRGPGANLNVRVNWKGYHKIDRVTAMQFTIQSFLLSKENWLPLIGVSFTTALRY
ncbi:pectinesterase-like [Gossypium australe]|uniref:Pectinesterase n=1 Tax=Gossypium australe TaxID=47621 RepID=A0A5B6W2D7_9ROSI|nr:pectinesterase-like [Gossypium australe]